MPSSMAFLTTHPLPIRLVSTTGIWPARPQLCHLNFFKSLKTRHNFSGRVDASKRFCTWNHAFTSGTTGTGFAFFFGWNFGTRNASSNGRC